MSISEVKHNLEYAMMVSPLIGTRFTLALAEFIWAITLFWPGDTFERSTYSGMAILLPENVWGLVFLLTSMFQTWLVLQGRYHCKRAVGFAAFNSFLWWFVCISMYTSVYPPPAGISGELALAFASSWIFIRSGFLPRRSEGESVNG